jgi:Ca2+-binding RTX toxin-like protein
MEMMSSSEHDGDDIIDGRGGNDTFCAGPGNDFIWGGFGSDTIYAGSGHDDVFGLLWSSCEYGDIS